MKVLPRLLVIGLITSALRIPLAILLASTTVRAEESGSQSAPVGLAVMQMSGRAFQEGLQAGDRDQARLFLWSLEGPDQSILGPDVPLFEPGCVAKFSEGVQCAYFPVVVNAIFAETFDTSTPDLVGTTRFGWRPARHGESSSTQPLMEPGATKISHRLRRARRSRFTPRESS